MSSPTEKYCTCDDGSCEACLAAMSMSGEPQSPPPSPPPSPARAKLPRAVLERHYRENKDELSRMYAILKENFICTKCGKKAFNEYMAVSRLMRRIYCMCDEDADSSSSSA